MALSLPALRSELYIMIRDEDSLDLLDKDVLVEYVMEQTEEKILVALKKKFLLFEKTRNASKIRLLQHAKRITLSTLQKATNAVELSQDVHTKKKALSLLSRLP